MAWSSEFVARFQRYMVTVFVIEEYALRGWIEPPSHWMHHSLTALGIPEFSGSGVGANHRQHLPHFYQTGRGGVRIDLRGVWIEQRNSINSRSILESVVVVLTEQKVRRRSCISRHRAGRHDPRRIVPTECTRRFG